MTNLLRATIATFGLNAALERYTRDLLKRGPDAAMRMNIPKVAQHYGLTEREVIDHRDLQFLPQQRGVQVWPEPQED